VTCPSDGRSNRPTVGRSPSGSGDGPPLLLVHGSVSDHTVFAPLVGELRDELGWDWPRDRFASIAVPTLLITGSEPHRSLRRSLRFPRFSGGSRSWSDWAKGGADCEQTEQVRA
jgi:pimeloyl-ACP methyl ester carboxylesterase